MMHSDLLGSSAYVFLDFEYRGDHPPDVLFGSFFHHPSGERITIDFRKPGAVTRLRELQFQWQDAVWAAFSVHAEMTCFLALGLDIEEMRWLDLFAEARQITGSHNHYNSRKAGLLFALEALGVPHQGNTAHKEAMRLLILETDPSTYTEVQEKAIIDYNQQDTDVLPALWEAIQQVHAFARKDYTLSAAMFRAEYVKALAQMEFRSRGFPVDVERLNLVYANLKLVRNVMAEACNEQYGGKAFRYTKRTDDYHIHFAGLVEHVDSLPFQTDWATTPSGRLRTDEAYLDEFARTNPYFEELKNTLAVLSQLKRVDLRPMVRNGFIRGKSIPYYTNTSRNQPLVSAGFLLNLPPWQRMLVRPEPQHRLVSADWVQQEVYIAAALSGDTALANALSTGDVYLALAKMADAVPPDATKQSHPVQRQTYKSVQLGVGYGMGVVALGKRIYLDLLQQGATNFDLDECTERASAILEWHRATFHAYWKFVRDEVEWGKQQGWMRARDGWTRFCNLNTRYTRLQNFHMQANGAVILREAVKELAKHKQIELTCTLHDSILIYCHEDDVTEHSNILRNAMTVASKRVLACSRLPLTIPVEIKPPEGYDHASGYVDERGVAMYQRVMHILQNRV